MTSSETIAIFEKYVIGNYRRFPVSLVRGEGSYVFDAEGKRYLDFFPGWGCNLLGHCPPRVVAAVREQVGKLVHRELGRLGDIIGYGREQSPSDLDTIADLQRLSDIFKRRGYTDADIERIMHANWLRFFKEAWAK